VSRSPAAAWGTGRVAFLPGLLTRGQFVIAMSNVVAAEQFSACMDKLDTEASNENC
jgi:hypothetical protein